MSIFNVKLPGNILGGAGAVSRIAAVASGKEKVVIFTDRGVREAGLLEAPLKTLKDAGIRTAVMDSVPPEPSWQQAQQAAGATGAGPDMGAAGPDMGANQNQDNGGDDVVDGEYREV